MTNKEACRKWYLDNREYCLRKAKEYHNSPTGAARQIGYRQRGKEVIRAAKNRPCMDCKTSYEYWIMQFDHRPGTEKKIELARATACSVKSIKEEIAKCDVVCANCHADRTYKRKYKGVLK